MGERGPARGVLRPGGAAGEAPAGGWPARGPPARGRAPERSAAKSRTPSALMTESSSEVRQRAGTGGSSSACHSKTESAAAAAVSGRARAPDRRVAGRRACRERRGWGVSCSGERGGRRRAWGGKRVASRGGGSLPQQLSDRRGRGGRRADARAPPARVEMGGVRHHAPHDPHPVPHHSGQRRPHEHLLGSRGVKPAPSRRRAVVHDGADSSQQPRSLAPPANEGRARRAARGAERRRGDGCGTDAVGEAARCERVAGQQGSRAAGRGPTRWARLRGASADVGR